MSRWFRMGGGRRGWAVMGLALALNACSTDKGPPLPDPPAVVLVTMSNYSLQYRRDVPAGRVVFRFVNSSPDVHHPTLLALPDDLPPFDAQLHGSERRVLTPFAGTDNLNAGETSTFAVDLVKGRRYGLASFAAGDDGVSDAFKGMNSEFRAGEPPTADPAKAAP